MRTGMSREYGPGSQHGLTETAAPDASSSSLPTGQHVIRTTAHTVAHSDRPFLRARRDNRLDAPGAPGVKAESGRSGFDSPTRMRLWRAILLHSTLFTIVRKTKAPIEDHEHAAWLDVRRSARIWTRGVVGLGRGPVQAPGDSAAMYSCTVRLFRVSCLLSSLAWKRYREPRCGSLTTVA